MNHHTYCYRPGTAKAALTSLFPYILFAESLAIHGQQSQHRKPSIKLPVNNLISKFNLSIW